MFKNLAGISLLVLAVGMISCSREIDRGVGTLQSVEVYDYKPHFACKDLGRENAVNWIEGVLGSSERGGSPDFFAISQLENQRIELPRNFDSLGAFCDHAGSERYADVIGIVYDSDTWTLNASFPITESGNACPIPDDSPQPATCTWGESTPCCACAGNPEATPPSPNGKPIGDRAFTIGRFQDRMANELCVVAANLPHPVDADGQRGCDLNEPINRLPNNENNGLFGTENFVNQLSALCSDVQNVIFLGDTNASNPNWSLSQMFPTGVMSQMAESNSEHFTCCLDFNADAPTEPPQVNQYPTDRIGVRGARSIVTTGGSEFPGIAMTSPTVYDPDTCPAPIGPESYGFPCCGSNEEHAPLRASILFDH
ncbi:MAG: hypothetical protein P8M78_04570 [Myxococcota bacterium]|nr:hypothetical protein [Myxococcota bacterium]